MILSAHFLTGAAIAANAPNPYLGLLFAYLSHYLFDLLPTWEYKISGIKNKEWIKTKKEFLAILLDISFGLLVFFFFSKNILIAGLGGFLAMIPDGLTLLFILFPQIGVFNRHFKIHNAFNYFKNKKTSLPIEVLTEALVYFLAIVALR